MALSEAEWKSRYEELKEKQKSIKEFAKRLLEQVKKINAEINDESTQTKQTRIFKVGPLSWPFRFRSHFLAFAAQHWLKRVSGRSEEDDSGRVVEAQFTRGDQEEAARHFMAARKRATVAEEKVPQPARAHQRASVCRR
jgi:hypothetical protein